MLEYDVDIVVGDDDVNEELIRLCFCLLLIVFYFGCLGARLFGVGGENILESPLHHIIY
jgi:hypothetical protein